MSDRYQLHRISRHIEFSVLVLGAAVFAAFLAGVLLPQGALAQDGPEDGLEDGLSEECFRADERPSFEGETLGRKRVPFHEVEKGAKKLPAAFQSETLQSERCGPGALKKAEAPGQRGALGLNAEKHGGALSGKAVTEKETLRVQNTSTRWDQDESIQSKTRSIYSYNADGRETERLRETWDGSAWVNSSRSSYTYNADGNWTEILTETWDGSAWVNSSRTSYTYNADGNRTEVLDETWDGSSWVNSSRTSYTYNADGRETEFLREEWDGSSWVKSSRRSYAYNADGNFTEFLFERREGGSLVKTFRRSYTYDADGNLTESLSERREGGSLVKSSRSSYTYDADGNRAERLQEDWDGSSWVNSSRTSYTYNADGNRTEYLRETWDGSSWMNSSRTSYAYDADGNWTEILREEWDGSAWVNSSRRSYTYNADGNFTEFLFETWDGNSWVNSSRTSYAYNADGRATERLRETWDGSSWVKRSRSASRYGVLFPPPGQASAEAADGSLALSWPEVTDDSLDGYRLYRSRESFEDTSQATRVGEGLLTGTSYSDDGLDNGGRYYYRLAAVSKSGLQSGLSEELLAVPYPGEVSVETSRSFGEASGPGDYRLVALPGQVDRPLGETLSGSAGTEWQAYWDEGSDFVKYDESETFTLQAGNGFWVTSTQEWSVSETLQAVSLSEDQTTAVPLNGESEWTIVSNPLDRGVPWSTVQGESGLDVPLWAYDASEGFVQADTMRSAAEGVAYYVLNRAGISALRIPYPRPEADKSTPKATPEPPSLAISARSASGEGPSSTVEVGLGEEQTLVAPPGRFEPVSLRLRPSSSERSLMRMRRPIGGDGETFRLRLTSESEGPVELSAENLDAIETESVALLHPSPGTTYDLRVEPVVQIQPSREGTTLKLAVGTESYVKSQASKVVPKKVSLTSYPNPVGQQGTLEYGLPEEAEVTLRIYDVLGREIATLQQGRKRAGRHSVPLNTDQLASGVYFGRLQAGDQTLTTKITVAR